MPKPPQVGTDVLAVPFVLGSNVLLFVTIPIFGEYERFHLRSSMECIVSRRCGQSPSARDLHIRAASGSDSG